MFGVVAEVPEVWRIGRGDDPWSFSTIDPRDAHSSTGNRFDIPGCGVLYTATEIEACYRETLGRFRPSPVMRALLTETEPGMMPLGAIPADWRVRRLKVRGVGESGYSVVDLESPETHEELNNRMSAMLAGENLELIDASSVRGMNRVLTRAIATLVYREQDPTTGDPLYAGIRYMSKLGPFECWVFFSERFMVDETFREPIENTDEVLLKVATSWGLIIH